MFRLLPILIVLMTAMIGAKLLEFMEILPEALIVTPIRASEAKAEPKKEESKSEEKKTEEKKEDKKQDKKKEEKKDGEKVSEDKPQDSIEHPEPKEPAPTLGGSRFTDAEVEILQDLAKRRVELDERERDISLKENSLVVIEKSLDKKIEIIKELQVQLQSVLAQYETKEDEKIKSLVKVYESMKPQDAAKIFEQLQMSILIEVSVHMKEAKLAQVLAKMDPYKAKELTIELANRRKIKDIK
ncbi:MAG: MotE family protein [Alphaproteobacteria bacterium]|jgi:flagellar motility protein MotE (MotC chaperone)|nr:hypothetical protein [Candidatus Jidaibacter sp.]